MGDKGQVRGQDVGQWTRSNRLTHGQADERITDIRTDGPSLELLLTTENTTQTITIRYVAVSVHGAMKVILGFIPTFRKTWPT